MKMLIDLQGCQSASRFRGIGRYSLALARAVVRNRGDHDVLLLANGAFGDGLSELRAHFAPEISPENFIVFDADFPVAEHDSSRFVECRLAEVRRERLIADIAPDAVLLTSLFEGFLDDAVTSVGCAGTQPPTAVILYDLIPYLRPDPNWPPEYKAYYDRKIGSISRADLLLSISDYARREAIEALPELDARIIDISTACDPKFVPGKVVKRRRDELLSRVGIRGPFLMSAGNIEPRKNFELIVRAFASLPKSVRNVRQIVLVGDTGDAQALAKLYEAATHSGFKANDLIVTGHLPDDDLRDLYRLCEIFVFPSKHEGFGLPALEAMSCGAPVIGSDATSLPEVIGRDDALFDPESVESLRTLIFRALTDEPFRVSLKEAGLERAARFSWDTTARRAIAALETLATRSASSRSVLSLPVKSAPATARPTRPPLALVTPLPPEQTGIADYVAELMPVLLEHYDITVISNQSEVLPGPNGEIFEVKPISWFEVNAEYFDRVMYHVGNSPFHAHMLDLVARYPGVVVLHDFFLSALTSWMETHGYEADAFKRTLFHGHGYQALADFHNHGLVTAKMKWPCSLEVVAAAQRLIVHSRHSCDLVIENFGSQFAEKVVITRLPRVPPKSRNRRAERARLGIAKGDFVVCAFGFTDRTKLNHRLLEAWAQSSFATDRSCRLIFVGGEPPADYKQIEQLIATKCDGMRVSITGFVSSAVFESYLIAADVAVQLRTSSRGETSRTVLDCMAYGLPVVVNAHGSLMEYPDDVLVKLEDEFATADLVAALDRLRSDASFRRELSRRGKEYVRRSHRLKTTVKAYVEAIEHCAASRDHRQTVAATRRFWSQMPSMERHDRARLNERLIELVRPERRPVIYLDISATSRNDLKAGIERVARSLLREMLAAAPKDYGVIPVYLHEEKGRWRVRRAHAYLAQQPGYPLVPPGDDVIIPGRGDVLVSLDLFADGVVPAEQQGLYAYWRSAGAKIGFIVYDLLPITHPRLFPPWARAMHESWIAAIVRAGDFLACISYHTKSELTKWMDGARIALPSRPSIRVFYLGADIGSSLPTKGLPADAGTIFDVISRRVTFLMVGTIEPRKGHLRTLGAFKKLWRRGVDINLVVVGREGWRGLPDSDRRTIPKIVAALRNDAEAGKRLFWLEGVSDEYLQEIYDRCDCLIAASEDEGFGLPLIEAAKHGIPVLARDIPVFREVGTDYAEFFSADDGQGIQLAVEGFVGRRSRSSKESRDCKGWISWDESARTLLSFVKDSERSSMGIGRSQPLMPSDCEHAENESAARDSVPEVGRG